MIIKMASYPSGKGLVCKTTMHRFDSDRRLYTASVLEAVFLCLFWLQGGIERKQALHGVLPLFTCCKSDKKFALLLCYDF